MLLATTQVEDFDRFLFLGRTTNTGLVRYRELLPPAVAARPALVMQDL